MKKQFALIAALTAIVSHQGAQAAEAVKPCMTSSELNSVVVALLPSLHTQVVTSCRSFLPANAAMVVGSEGLTASYQAAAADERVAAGDALKKLFGKDMPAQMPGTALLPFVEAMVPEMLGKELDAKSCVIANNIWSAMAPLPPQNIASMLGAIILAASQDKKPKEDEKAQVANKSRFNDLEVCPYVATAENKAA
ncbi:MAG: hypothetical protein ACRCY3_08255 [Sphingorhabdus sp.]